MNISGAEKRIHKDVKNLDKDRFRIVKDGKQYATVIVCLDNKLYERGFNLLLDECLIVIDELNLFFDQGVWEEHKYGAIYDHTDQFVSKMIYKDYHDISNLVSDYNTAAGFDYGQPNYTWDVSKKYKFKEVSRTAFEKL